MYNIISRILFALFIIAGGSYALFAFKVKKSCRNIRGMLFHGLYALILMLQGIAFLSYYPYNRFGFLSTMNVILFISTGIVLAFYFDTERQRRIVMLVFILTLLFLTIWKLLTFSHLTFIGRLPLNVCNILIIFIAIRPLFKSQMLDNYIMCFGIIAGFISYFIGAFYDDVPGMNSFGAGFFYYQMLESSLLHNLFFAYCGYTFLKKIILVKPKAAMKNMSWVIPLFCVFIFCNQLWKTDFFFTGTYGITPQFLIDIYYMLPLRFELTINDFVFDINIIYTVFLLCATSLILYICSSLFAYIQKKEFVLTKLEKMGI